MDRLDSVKADKGKKQEQNRKKKETERIEEKKNK
jgi:hypothetical protein